MESTSAWHSRWVSESWAKRAGEEETTYWSDEVGGGLSAWEV